MTPELTETIKIALLVLLIVCAVAASLMKRLVPALIVFTSFSLVMALVWILLESPDLAITEAAVGAGVSGVLFYMAIRRMGQFEQEHRGAGKVGEVEEVEEVEEIEEAEDTDAADKNGKREKKSSAKGAKGAKDAKSAKGVGNAARKNDGRRRGK